MNIRGNAPAVIAGVIGAVAARPGFEFRFSNGRGKVAGWRPFTSKFFFRFTDLML